MPFFDANKMGITIDYDDNMCLVGGSLRGVVNIFVRETVTLCGASLRYRIVEGCSLGKFAHTSPDCYAIEYVLFGARSTKHAPPVRVQQGHYSYPFAIPIPPHAPPSQRFGGSGDPSLMNLFLKDVAPGSGPIGPAVRIEHLVEVVVYVAHSWKDKHQSKHAPCVVKCTTPAILTSLTNGMEGHIRNGHSLVYPGKSFFSKLFNSGPTKSKEQADCDLFIYNTTVTLADSPFLHFAIRGKTNCPYQIQLVRCVAYTLPETNESRGTKRSNNQTANSVEDDQASSTTTSRPPRPPIVDETVISSTTMPPLNAPAVGVKGRLLISPFAQEHSVSFASRSVSVSYYVTMTLQYLSNRSSSMIAPEYKMKIPINIFHGTFEEAHSYGNDPNQPSYAANAPADGYIVTGSVMGYDAPPAGEQGMFRPAAPVTDSGVSTTMWSNPIHEPTIIRPNRPQSHVRSGNSQQPLRGATGVAPPALHTSSPSSSIAPPARENTVSGRAQEPAENAAEEPGFSNPLMMSRIPLSTANRRANTGTNAGENNDSSHYVYRGNGNSETANAPVVSEEDPDFQCITPPAERLSVHRRMYEHVPPTWVQKERKPAEPIEELSSSAPSQQDQTLPATPADGSEVTTTTFI